MGVVFVEAERGVGGIGPCGAVADVAAWSTDFFQILTSMQDIVRYRATVEAERIPFRTGAVVTQEKDNRILILPGGFQMRKDSPDGHIHVIKHCSIYGHAAREVVATILREGIPGGNLLVGPAGFLVVGIARHDFPWRECHVLGNEPQFFLPCQSFLAYGVPAFFKIQGFILGDV